MKAKVNPVFLAKTANQGMGIKLMHFSASLQKLKLDISVASTIQIFKFAGS